VVDEKNQAAQRSVQVGATIGSGIIIEEGLKAGERVIVEGVQKVREGAPVQPLTAAQLAQAAAPQPATSAKE